MVGRGQTVCPLQGGCPLFRVSIIRGSAELIAIQMLLSSGLLKLAQSFISNSSIEYSTRACIIHIRL